MKVTLAKTAGFCFGVDRALSLCDEWLSRGEKIATLGEIIHNASVVEELKARGCGVADSADDVQPGTTLIIRSHGVGEAVYRRCAERGVQLVDATCPFVSKIHEIVRQYGEQGFAGLIAGDGDHPEVQGILGHCAGDAYVFSDVAGFRMLMDGTIGEKPCFLVAQTTYNLQNYLECGELAKKYYTKLLVFDTICSATRARQQEAEQLSKANDACIVIGGRNSSNTAKLTAVCEKNCRTYRVEAPEELRSEMFEGIKAVGVTAGASTPLPLIQEVLNRMDELIREDLPEENQLEEEPANEEEFNFMEALEDSLRLVRRGQRIDGIVTSILPNEVVVDIGTKHTGFIPADEISDDPTMSPSEVVSVGDKLHLIVTKVEDLEGVVTLSKKRVDSEAGMKDLEKAAEEGTLVNVFITEAVNKGLVALYKGVRIFIPASQASARRGEPYEHFARTNQQIKIIEFNPSRRRAIGSLRAIQEGENEKIRAAFWQEIEQNKRYQGVVKSLTVYGAFVDLGGVDGMVHRSELSWNRADKPSDVLVVGQKVEVYVKDFDIEKKRISLGYRNQDDNPWEKIKELSIGSEFEAPVVSVTAFGAFVRVLPGIDGLVHISEMADGNVKSPASIVKVGDTVRVRLLGTDFDKKRVSLSMKPSAGEEAPPPETPAEEVAAPPEEAEQTAEAELEQ